ncbi:MAG: hypothetical protein RLZZ127_1601 [Planctomycetota bacterium]|jgi:hypothetical protein
MRFRPDPAAAVAALEAIARHPAAAWDALSAAAGGPDAPWPLVAWPLIEAQRAAGVLPGAALLERLDRDLDAWDRRFGIATAAPAACSVAAQAWLVQDLHCLADLHNHAGDGRGAAWSRRGHAAEAALHRDLWTGTAYADRDDAGRLVAADPGDACQPLLLLDTPPDRVAAIASGAAAVAAGGGPLARLAAIGLARHRR